MNDASPEMMSLFCAALEHVSPDERDAYLDAACGQNQELRARLEVLLRAHERAGGFLPAPFHAGLAPTTRTSLSPESVGSQVGPYKLLEQIGEGGMGLVYVAEQRRPVRRTVALKLIKPGMDTKHVIARFEAERQALALMDHPNIAKVLDAGSTEAGRPYFVMELVRGIPITEYCDQARFSIRQRLEVFVQVCRAVQHAHTKGIIHRDLKPSNVLVTSHDGIPVPVVIDFGVAKALGRQLTEQTLHTGFAQMIGTPLYMSPEQAEFNQIGVDTRSDIYSLGVLLYELLTGVTPFDRTRLKTASYDEFRRILREEDPPRPSARLSTIGNSLSTASERRGVDSRKLTQTLQGELDWIVVHSMEKDRTRRYESASAFANDVERYLRDEPVEVVPPSVSYRLKKFARRYRRQLIMATTLALGGFVAVGSLAGSVGWALRDRQARQTALERGVGEALADVQRWFELGKLTEALAAVKRAEALLTSDSGTTELGARVAQWRNDLDMVDRVQDIRFQRSSYTNDTFDYDGTDAEYTRAFREYGIDVKQLDPTEAAKRIRSRAIGLQLAAALDDWADTRKLAGKTDQPTGRELAALARAADADGWRTQLRDAVENQDRSILLQLIDSPQVSDLPAPSQCLLGSTLAHLGEVRRGTQVLWKAQRKHPDDFWLNYELAYYLNLNGAPKDEVVRYYTAALALQPDSVGVHINLANALREHGRNNQALMAYRECLRLDPASAVAHCSLGLFFKGQKKLDEAIAEYREAIRLNPAYAIAYVNLCGALGLQDKLDEAILVGRKATELNPNLSTGYYNLGLALKQKGKLDEAIAAYREVIRLAPSDNGYNNLGNALSAQGKLEPAIAAFKESLRLKPDNALAYNNLGTALARQKKFADAIPSFREAICLKPNYFVSYFNLCLAAREIGDASDSIRQFEAAVTQCTDDEQICEGGFYLASLFQASGNPTAAGKWYEKSALRMDTKKLSRPDLRALRAQAAADLGIKRK